ncbi:MAG: hypothetical protein ACLTDR_01820 [Adlercreutzia equolifaciens]
MALTVAYFAQPKSFEEIGDGRAAVSPGRTTSEALAQCLAARSDATPVRVGALAVDAAAGTVHLAVHLAYDGRFWSMDLTVEGPRGTYVVRDLEAFAHRVQRGEHFSYGKKLAFAHRLEAFDGPSRAVARKVAELFPDERLFGGSMFRTAGSKRAVRLREAELAGMLGAMGEGLVRCSSAPPTGMLRPLRRRGGSCRGHPGPLSEFAPAEGADTICAPSPCSWCADWRRPSCFPMAPRGCHRCRCAGLRISAGGGSDGRGRECGA